MSRTARILSRSFAKDLASLAMSSHFRGAIFLVAAMALFSAGCVQELVVTYPDLDLATLAGTEPVPDSAKPRLEGVYQVMTGDSRFGSTVVLKYSGDVLSVFTERNVGFMLLYGGVRDSGFVFTGTWRFAQSQSAGRVELAIAPDDGGRALLRNDGVQPQPVLVGASGGPNQKSKLNVRLELRFLRPITRHLGGFWDIAHRGGGRNSDRHPYSENSLPMLSFAPHLGANGVEVDVRLTKDGVAVLFHDEELSTRLVQGNYLTGPIGNYTFRELETFARLIHGEKIPTLAEALDSIVQRTDLTLVWLDMKEPASVQAVVLLAREFMARARARGRELEILIGIPDTDILEAWLASNHAGVSALCELGLEETRRAGAAVWAPRWTLGTLNDEVAQMHAEGRRVFVWTLDVPSFITTFLQEGDFDGILTNYPALVAYHAYSHQ